MVQRTTQQNGEVRIKNSAHGSQVLSFNNNAFPALINNLHLSSFSKHFFYLASFRAIAFCFVFWS